MGISGKRGAWLPVELYESLKEKGRRKICQLVR